MKDNRKPGLSLLDYLWVNYAEFSVSKEPTENPDQILTLGAINSILLEFHGVSSVKVIEEGDNKILEVKNSDGKVFTYPLPASITITSFTKRLITQADRNKGCALSLNTWVYAIMLSDGNEYIAPIDKYIGNSSEAIIVDVLENVIYAELKISNRNSIVSLGIFDDGLSADLNISKDTEGISFEKKYDGLSANVVLQNSDKFIKFSLLTSEEYFNLVKEDLVDETTMYFIKGSKYFYFGLYKMGGASGSIDLDNYYTKLLIDNKLKDTADAKVASVTAAANTAITVAGTATAPTIGLKIANTQGNVTLSQTADGLKANTSFPVTGVKADDKVLSMTGTTVGSTLGLTYDSTNKAIKLTGIGGSEIASIDASEFIKDGMVDNVEFTEATKILTITFNTASGKEAIDVDLSALVDAYNGANLKLTAASGFAKDTVLDLAINALKTDITNAAAAGVTKFGGKTGEITVKGGQTANGAVNLEMADNELKASVVGLGSAAYTASTAYATAAQGGKADTAIQTVREANTGTYISVAAAKSGTTINLTPSVTILTVATAGSSKGLAEASDVKAYADSLFAWEEL